jgi:hypothetical protein
MRLWRYDQPLSSREKTWRRSPSSGFAVAHSRARRWRCLMPCAVRSSVTAERTTSVTAGCTRVEVDGRGRRALTDDANLPSLLSAPLFGYLSADDPAYRCTRSFVLSHHDPSSYRGRYATGVGSAHTLITRALTAGRPSEVLEAAAEPSRRMRMRRAPPVSGALSVPLSRVGERDWGAAHTSQPTRVLWLPESVRAEIALLPSQTIAVELNTR